MRKKNLTKTVGLLLLLMAVVYASEQMATDRAMEKVISFKEQGFVNVRGERRGYLADKGELEQGIKMFENQEYLAVVSGDDDMEEVKLLVKDKAGTEVLASGTTEGKTAFVTYTPKAKGKYSFVIEVPKRGGYYHFALVTK